MEGWFFNTDPGPQVVEFVAIGLGWNVYDVHDRRRSSYYAANVSELSNLVRELLITAGRRGVLIRHNYHGTSYRCDSWEQFENNVESIAARRPPAELGLEVSR